MREHAIVAGAKICLLAMILVALIFHFIGINETQTKVIETAVRVDAMKDQVADLDRRVREDGRDASLASWRRPRLPASAPG